ncbi:isopentenyl phosphate kinase [Methanofollis fontis]|uniref:Isopentenyl phosphate kinase n=1 Tax=Methanofollis fontis TaxID=2052832 RepID=A0A483CVE4_9EURY|nr:isopentenyl phosphate kinase [Methanofollis fontis]TAJ43376.1 uridylate kinase [Methanofollis fontis]
MVEEIRLLKLGGSIVTDKGGGGGIDHARLAAIAREIAERGDAHLVIVHGAGSCGHPEAQEYRIQEGVDLQNRAGIAITHEAVAGLNRSVVAALRAEGVDAVGIHPLAACHADNGQLLSCEHQSIDQLVRLGITPVLHGDVVMDTSRGACIISGDQIIRYLAQALGAGRVGLATDVPGVLDRGAVVPVITREHVKRLSIGCSGNTDVTGGMKGKIEELLKLADSGIESHIFHVSHIADFLDGKEHGGTIVRR